MNTDQKSLIFSLIVVLLAGMNGNAQSTPDILWEPEPFRYEAGLSQKYIDFENGNDSNPGTKANPWKHHPWDQEASRNAASSKGIHTYVFKKGVTYRGQLISDESGKKNNPIRLTVDPDWGQGEATIVGSEVASSSWKRYKEENGLPFPKSSEGKIWFVDLEKKFKPKLLWVVNGDKITRIPIAREPDWTPTNTNDPKTEWWEWTDHKYTGIISVESIEGFEIGDKIWFLDDDKTSAERYIVFEADKIRQDRVASAIVITGISENNLHVEVSDYATFKVNKKTLTNGSIAVKSTSDIINRNHRLIDSKNLVSKDPDYYEGAMVWTEQLSYAGYGHPGVIKNFSLKEQSIVMSPMVPWLETQKRSPSKYCRYFLENKPQYLDTPGEFYFSKEDRGNRLYLRLPDDSNPNKVQIELARHETMIEIGENNHINISGLSFRFENIKDWLGENEYVSAVQLKGNSTNITVSHCKFEHVIKAMAYYPLEDGDVADFIEITDSEINYTDHNAIALRYGVGTGWGFNKRSPEYPLGRLKHVKVLRNKLYEIGNRPSPGDAIHAVEIKGGELVEIAYNIIDRTYASAIQAMNNRWSAETDKMKVWESPLNRCLVHHNKVTNTMLQGNDWGSIASWGVGPSYVYNNITGNSVGHRYSYYRDKWTSKNDFDSFFTLSNPNFGTAFYFDQMYKGYLFNNIAWGNSNNIEDQYYNTYGYFQTRGPLTHVFQNTFYNFVVGTMTFESNFRCFGNLYLNTGYSHLIHSAPVTSSTAYTNNAFHGDVKAFGLGGGKETFNRLNEFQKMLEKDDPFAFTAGFVIENDVVQNAAEHDFRLVANAPIIDQGVKVFVPWGLYKVVGEWHFYKDRSNPSVIMDEHLYLNDEWRYPPIYSQIPRHDLTAHQVFSGDYQLGMLEDWVEGSLSFNGKDQYCDIDDASTKADYSWKMGNGQSGTYPGEKRVSLDAGNQNFLIEVVFKTSENHTGGTLVSKGTDQHGYHLAIDENGKIQLRLGFGEGQYVATGLKAVNDDKWHHLVAEVDRKNGNVSIYVDGKLSEINKQGVLPKFASLRNQGDFTVGRLSMEETNYFHGSIDFLRLSQGSLEDAETTIEELYEWEFDGPFLKDFYGNKPTGKSRDIGALELSN